MASNKNALIRYKTIDKCLQNPYRKWTLNDLIEACSDALYEYEGKPTNVSKRTVQLDIQTMRSDKLGYNAPIIVVDKKHYTYEDPNYSIMNLPISGQDLEKLSETVAFLSQFKGFSHFTELQEVVQKLEDHVYANQTNTQPVIDFEKNEGLKGLHFLDILHKHIMNKQSILMTYQSFKTRQPNSFTFFPYLLKEFRNRWFVVGRRKAKGNLINLALDRILSIDKSDTPFAYNDIDLEAYYKVAIGVSIDPKLKTEKILLFVARVHAPYIETKPMHHSQKTIERSHHGIVIQLDVQHNFELEKEILGYGEAVRVIAPQRLRNSIRKRLANAVDNYDTDIHIKRINNSLRQFNHSGCVILNYVYSKREIRTITNTIHQKIKHQQNAIIQTINLFENKQMRYLFLNQNINNLIKLSGKKLQSIVFYPKPDSNQNVWHQRKDVPKDSMIIHIYLSERNELKTKMQVYEGSQHKLLNNDELRIVTETSVPKECNTRFGGIILTQPQLLQKMLLDMDKGSAYIELVLTGDIEPPETTVLSTDDTD